MKSGSLSLLLRGVIVVSGPLVLAPSEAQLTFGPPEAPISTETAKLHADHHSEYTAFGRSVAVSGDIALVSAVNGGRGVTDVFVRSGGAWTKETTLTASDEGSLNSVSISGHTALIGSSESAYVFTRNNGVWTNVAKLSPSDAAQGDGFGASVAIDGDTAIVGASGKQGSLGAAYVFTRNGAVWSQQAKLIPDSSFVTAFGFAVAVSGDTAAVGAPGGNSVYMFTRDGGVWSQQARHFGFRLLGLSVAVSDNAAVAGDPAAQPSLLFPSLGLAFIYEHAEGLWLEQVVTAPDWGVGDTFGSSVAIAGNIAVIGSPGDSDGTGNVRPEPRRTRYGSAYVFTRNGNGVWAHQAKLNASDADTGDAFGTSVAVNGNTAVIGAPGDDEIGAAYVFSIVSVLLDQLRQSSSGVGPGRSLVTKIEHAQAYEAAQDKAASCSMLAAFMNEVSAQTGKKVSLDKATELTSRAKIIVAQIGCPDTRISGRAGKL